MSEQVFCVRTDIIDSIFPEDVEVDPNKMEDRYLDKLIMTFKHKDIARFIYREFAEKDENWRQIIPYCIVSDETSVLMVRRTKKQGEERLHNKTSIGIGGHINPCDAFNYSFLIDTALERELSEELDWWGVEHYPEPIGYIKVNDTAVDRVHFGLVYMVHIMSGKPAIKEDDKMKDVLWVPFDQPELILESNPETWSKLIVEKMVEDEFHFYRYNA